MNTLIVDKDNITTAAPSVTTNVLLLKIGFSNKNNTHFIGFSNKNNTYFIGFSNNTSYIQITGEESTEDTDPSILNLTKFNPKSVLT